MHLLYEAGQLTSSLGSLLKTKMNGERINLDKKAISRLVTPVSLHSSHTLP